MVVAVMAKRKDPEEEAVKSSLEDTLARLERMTLVLEQRVESQVVVEELDQNERAQRGQRLRRR